MNLMPGLRDLRTPLAVGYLWLAALWLAWGDKLPAPEHATGIIAGIYRASTAVGATAALAALTFVAYVLGTLLQPLAAPIDKVAGFFMRYTYLISRERLFGGTNDSIIRLAREEADAITSTYRTAEIEQAMGSDDRAGAGVPIGAYSANHPSRPLTVGDVREYVTQLLYGNLDGIVAQLQVYDKQEPYQAYDRNLAEYQFRSGISAPILAVIVVFAIRITPLALLALFVPFVLAWQGQKKRDEAHLSAYQPVTERIIEAPAMKNFKAKLQEIRKREDETRAQEVSVRSEGA